MVQCSMEDCDNEVFSNLDKCILHCEKNGNNDVLNEFEIKFKEYLIKYILVHSKNKNELRDVYRQNGMYGFFENSAVKESVISQNIEINDIIFPKTETIEYFYDLKLFKKIRFLNCIFHQEKLNLNKPPISYHSCKFNSIAKIDGFPLEGYKIEDNIFEHCIFEHDVLCENIKEDKETRNINAIFRDCTFKENIYLDKNVFNCYVLDYTDGKNSSISLSTPKEVERKIKHLKIYDCTFHKKFHLNKFKISELTIEDCYFKSKLEIKKSDIISLDFHNSNVDKVFDTYETIFHKFYMEKSIFEDFAGFEKVKFGCKEQAIASIFQYVTFKSFSNFRKAKFFSGLDLSSTNLKEQPNFLDAFIEPTNTDRETFRIIKNSFDKSGSHIEANKYFSQEMRAYKKQLKSDKEFQGKEYRGTKIVVYVNDFISNFGDSYIRPFVILLVSLVVYSGIVYINQCLIKHRYYLISPFYEIVNFFNQLAINFLPFTKFLEKNEGVEFISLLFYVWFLILIWQIFVAVKRKVIRE